MHHTLTNSFIDNTIMAGKTINEEIYLKDWNYGINSLYKTGHISLEEAPWYVFAIACVVEWICDHMPAIPLPDDPIKDEDGNNTTLKAYYGELNHLWHDKVDDPVFQWAEKQKRTVVIDFPYEKLREIFYEKDKNFFGEEEKIAQEIEEKEE
jgi:hypothetical protein